MGKKIAREILFLVLGFVLGAILCFSASSWFLAPSIMPIFSPDNGDEIIKAIDGAQKSIEIEVYVFTSEEVVEALKRAHWRGVSVRVIMEKRVLSDDNKEIFALLNAAGIDVRWASYGFKLTHAKFMIIDGEKVIVGSHNLSDSALNYNRETSVLIENSNVIEQFKKIFENDWAIAQFA